MLRIFAFILGFIATAAFAQTYPPQITAIDPATKITITDLASANTKRADLVGSIFGPSGMSATLVPSYYSTFNPAGTTWAKRVERGEHSGMAGHGLEGVRLPAL